MSGFFDFEDFKNDKFLEASNIYISKVIELIDPIVGGQSDLLVQAISIKAQIDSVLQKAHATKEEIQTLIGHIKDINQGIEACKELAPIVFLIAPFFQALHFFLM